MAKEAWHVQYGSHIINCSVLLNVDIEQYNTLEIIDHLPEEKIDELQDAHEWATKRKELGY